MKNDVIDSKYEDLSKVKKQVWLHHRRTVLIIIKFTQLLINGIAKLTSDLEPILSECTIDQNLNLEYKKTLHKLNTQIESFEEIANYNIFEDFDITKINVAKTLSRVGQINSYYLSLVNTLQKISLKNPHLNEMIFSCFDDNNTIVENIYSNIKKCRSTNNLFALPDSKLKDIFKRRRSTKETILNEQSDQLSILNNEDHNLSLNIKKKITAFQNNDIRSHDNCNIVMKQFREIISLCNKFIINNARIHTANIAQFMYDFSEMILDCEISADDYRNYRIEEMELRKVIRDLDERKVNRDLINKLNIITNKYMKTVSSIVENNPILKPFYDTNSNIINSLFKRITLTYDAINSIKEEYKIQVMVIEFNHDYKSLTAFQDKITDLLVYAWKKISKGQRHFRLNKFSDILEPIAKFDEKWGNEAFYLGAPVGGTYLPQANIGIIDFIDEYKKYYNMCGSGNHFLNGEDLNYDIQAAIKNNTFRFPSYSYNHLCQEIQRQLKL